MSRHQSGRSPRRPSGPIRVLSILGSVLLTPTILVAVPAAALGQESESQQLSGRAIDPDALPRPTATAARAPSAISIDGVLDDAAWAAAPVIDRFVQQKPDAGALSTERTEVRILYDDDHLYVGAELFDSGDAEPIIPTLQRDPNTRDGDAFGFAFDTFGEGKTVYAFFVNPGGAVRDTQTSDDGRINNAAWNAEYDLRTRVHDRGWTVEIAIPWSALRFDATQVDQVWKMNLLRRIRRKNEDAVWAPMDRQWQLYVTSRAGTLRGIRGLSPTRNFSLKPFVLTSEPSGATLAEADTEFDAGLDMKYGITPGLTLDLTVNTDFSQVEVDQQQVNLTRFSLFFPEKREFFLENAGVFQFGDRGQRTQRNGASNSDFTLFHSRRVGLTPSGTPLPILGGARVSGTAGPLSVGFLNMQTRAEGDFAAENFTVARLRAEPTAGLTVGGIFVNRAATGDGSGDNQSFGVDLDYQAFNNYFLIQSYLAGSSGTATDGSAEETEFAGRVSASWRDPFWELVGMVRQLDDEFNPGAGFVRRKGVRHLYGSVGVHPRGDWPLVQELNPYVEWHNFTTLGGDLETREVKLGLDFDFNDGAMAQIGVSDLFERVDDPFSVRGATVESGSYDFREVSASYNSSRARPLSGRVSVSGGGYFGGDRFTVGGSLFGRLGYRWLLTGSAQHNRIELPEQMPTTADVFSAKLDAFFSTRLLTSAFVQYNEASQELVTNIRLNWIHAPLSDLFIVLTERRSTELDTVLDRFITLKFTKLLSF